MDRAAVACAGAIALFVTRQRRRRAQATKDAKPCLEFDFCQLDEAAACFSSSGVVVVRGLLEGADLQQIQKEIKDYIRDIVPTKSEKDAFYDGGKALKVQ
jgi:hypothetical protein